MNHCHSAVSSYVLLFGIAHLLFVELDDDGAELENLPQQRILRKLDVDAGPERLKERERCEKSLWQFYGAQEEEGRG